MQKQRALARLLEQIERAPRPAAASVSGATHGVFGRCRKRAHKLDAAARLADKQDRGAAGSPTRSRRCFRSAMTGARPSVGERQRRACGCCAPLRSARPTVASSFCSAIGFSRKSIGADPRRLDRGVDGAVAGHHHHRHGEQAGAGPLLEQRDAVGVRHPDVEQHEVGARLRCAAARACAGILGERAPVALVAQNLREQLADADFVVDDQYLFMVRLVTSARRSCSRGVAGSAGSDDASRARRAASTFSISMRAAVLLDDLLHDGEPQPVPLGLVVT